MDFFYWMNSHLKEKKFHAFFRVVERRKNLETMTQLITRFCTILSQTTQRAKVVIFLYLLRNVIKTFFLLSCTCVYY